MAVRSYETKRYLWYLEYWRRVYNHMDKALIAIIGRICISVGILVLIGLGRVTGTLGIPAVTIIVGFDLAELVKAIKLVKSDDVSFTDNRK